MMAFFAIPAVLGLGLAYEYLVPLLDEVEEDENENHGPVQFDMGEDLLTFQGGDMKDHVQGNALDNMINGGERIDRLMGDDGNDTINGETGNDRLFGDAGNDLLIGAEGDDRMFGGAGNDLISSQGGADAGDDMIRGGAGRDVITDGQGADLIYGDPGADFINSVETGGFDVSDDTVDGGYGNDTLFGDSGDLLTGGEGADSFVVAARSEENGIPAMLLDFDISEDLFSVVLLDENAEPPEVAFEHNAETNQLTAVVNGQHVAILNDIDAEDVPFIQTFVTSLPDLLGDSARA